MTFYRYVIVDMGYDYPCPEIRLHKFFLVKETPKGYWIRPSHSLKQRWISKTSKKRYAYPTKEEAAVNLKKRTEIYVGILERKLANAKIALNDLD